jgi:hypothetical protein
MKDLFTKESKNMEVINRQSNDENEFQLNFLNEDEN